MKTNLDNYYNHNDLTAKFSWSNQLNGFLEGLEPFLKWRKLEDHLSNVWMNLDGRLSV